MKISIFQKQILYSNKLTACFLLPKTSFKVTLFPTRLELEDLEGTKKTTFSWLVEGGVKKFHTELNLEKERIEISGITSKGFFRFILKANEGKILLTSSRSPEEAFSVQLDGVKGFLASKQTVALIEGLTLPETSSEKLSFGMHKALDIHKISDRKDLKEIFPIWFSLYQKIQSSSNSHREGVAKLLEFPEEKIALEKQFQDLFLLGFVEFIPRLTDGYQGYLNEDSIQDASPLVLLKEIGSKIRSMFFMQNEGHFYLLQTLLQPFMCGRLLNIDCEGFGKMDFEWSKRRLTKVIFYPDKSDTIHIHPHKDIKNFRLRRFLNDKGVIVKPGVSIDTQANKPLFLDRFEK